MLSPNGVFEKIINPQKFRIEIGDPNISENKIDFQTDSWLLPKLIEIPLPDHWNHFQNRADIYSLRIGK